MIMHTTESVSELIEKACSAKGWDPANYDYYDLLIDGKLANYISGEIDWTTETVILGKGRHAITWSYTKDEFVSEGIDAAWLDKVTWKRTGSESNEHDDDDDDD